MACGSRLHYAYVDDQIRVLMRAPGTRKLPRDLGKATRVDQQYRSRQNAANEMLQGVPVHYMRGAVAEWIEARAK